MAYIAETRTTTGQVRYRAFIRRRGHKTITKQFRRKTDADRWARRAESQIEEGRDFPTAEARRRRVAELIERYVEQVLPSRPERDRPRVNNQLRWWSKRLGTLRLTELTPAVIGEHRDRLLRGDAPGGKPVSPATANRYLAALSHACSIAVREWGWLEDHPVRKVRRMKEPRGRVRFLSEEEREALLEACRASHDKRLYPLALMAVSTGARRGELLALRWGDIDLVRGYVVVQDSKNGERRSLPLAGAAKETLGEMARLRRIDTDLVFANETGKAPFPRKPWMRALESAGIEDFLFHDLRHTAASYLAMSGATLTEIATILGHKTLAMVKRYSHLTEQHTAAVVERMNRQFVGG